ncbi:MAG TPA: DUF2147 domain-containing protein [Blastocatellia bacterium]|nr:DUF2147 domain-containing protein [Blastocatellia bacterium]
MRRCLIGYTCVLMLLLCDSRAGKSYHTSFWQASPVGRWRSVDGATGKVNSIVVIWEANGKLYGKIEKLVNPDPGDPNPRCTRCDGELKGRPLIGLQILWDLVKDGDEWSGGRILDPDNGKVYKCYIALEDGGKKLKVRGYLGFSLLGRTEYWLRDQ